MVKEDMSGLFFKPIREDLKKVSGVTKENYANKMERALELRRLLRKIGDFIRENLEGEKSLGLEVRLWYVLFLFPVSCFLSGVWVGLTIVGAMYL